MASLFYAGRQQELGQRLPLGISAGEMPENPVLAGKLLIGKHDPSHQIPPPLSLSLCFLHRSRPAIRAISDRLSGESLRALASPPRRPISRTVRSRFLFLLLSMGDVKKKVQWYSDTFAFDGASLAQISVLSPQLAALPALRPRPPELQVRGRAGTAGNSLPHLRGYRLPP